MMRRLLILMLAGVLGAMVSPLAGCSTNPATGKKQFNILSEEEEVSIGDENAPVFLDAYGGELPSPEIIGYVRDIGHKLTAVSERPDLPWEFHVLDSPVINAFALPGGKVFISRALLERMTNEAQLAGVLGHEVGHVTAQHIGQQMSQQLVVSGVLIGVGIGAQASDEDWAEALGVGAAAGGTLYILKYGRDQESQADELGVRYMAKLGYNPIAQIQVMKILMEASGGGQLEIFSTHPHPESRIKNLERYIQEQYPNYDEPGAYRLYQDRFEKNVLVPIKDLPPPPKPKQ